MSVDSEHSKSETKMEVQSRIDLENGTAAQISKEPDCKRWLMSRKACTVICLVCVCTILSFFTSVVTTKYLLPSTSLNEAQGTRDCKMCVEEELKGIKPRDTQCCQLAEQGNILPAHAKQVQEASTSNVRTGAQLSANQALLQGETPRMAWSHDGPDDYLDGIKHVTYYHRNYSFDCLEVTQGGHYLTTIQLTYSYASVKTSGVTKPYFTLTRFRNNQPHLVARTNHVIPAKDQRSSLSMKQPATMVRSDPFIKGDKVCVTVSHPELIYVSKIDNFFGMVAL